MNPPRDQIAPAFAEASAGKSAPASAAPPTASEKDAQVSAPGRTDPPDLQQRRILIRGAREHNLKNLTLSIPRDKFVVITGLSGSGKSSLAFDTIFAEGQRRYVESLSAYARQFL